MALCTFCGILWYRLQVETMAGIAAHAMERIMELEKQVGIEGGKLTVTQQVGEGGGQCTPGDR